MDAGDFEFCFNILVTTFVLFFEYQTEEREVTYIC